MNTLGVITIGQAPRDDLIPDIEPILTDIKIVQKGALDDFTFEEVGEKFAPETGETVLVSRMRDGRQVRMSERLILPLVQKKITEMEEMGIQVILLLCTGKFPSFAHRNLLISPLELLHSIVKNLADEKTVGLVVPDSDQVEQVKRWWGGSGLNIETAVGSPYLGLKGVEDAANQLAGGSSALIFLDCMGYNLDMKKRVQAITGKPVILPRTILARIIKDMF